MARTKSKSASRTPSEKQRIGKKPITALLCGAGMMVRLDVMPGQEHIIEQFNRHNCAVVKLLVEERNQETQRRQPKRRADDALNEAILRFGQDFEAGKLQTWKDVRAALKSIDPAWTFKNDTIRIRYARLKSKPTVR